MFNVNMNLYVPDHSGVPANLIYELPNGLGIRHEPNNAIQLCSIHGISLPYIMLSDCFIDDQEIQKAYIEALNTIHCITGNYANIMSVIGKESFEILGASVQLPGMSPISNTGVFANPNHIYMAQIENGCCLALLKRVLLSNGFRFKALGTWFGIVNDVTIVSDQPSQLYQQDRVYGFVIDSNNSIYPINETGTIY